MPSALDLLHLATTAAERAAAYLRTVQRPMPPTEWGQKGRHDFVTAVDRTAERIIAEVLLAAEPRSRIVGEELTPNLETEGLVWIVDPLDGTTNFLHGYPAYAVSIAASCDGRLEAGVVVDVPRNCVYQATRGGGAWESERRLQVSAIQEPEHALIGTGFPFKHLQWAEKYSAQMLRVLRSTSGIRRAGSAALDLADVAAGRFDGFWELMLAPWDIAAGVLLIREAGGAATDFQGRQLGVQHAGVVAGNPVIHEWLLRVLSAEC